MYIKGIGLVIYTFSYAYVQFRTLVKRIIDLFLALYNRNLGCIPKLMKVVMSILLYHLGYSQSNIALPFSIQSKQYCFTIQHTVKAILLYHLAYSRSNIFCNSCCMLSGWIINICLWIAWFRCWFDANCFWGNHTPGTVGTQAC